MKEIIFFNNFFKYKYLLIWFWLYTVITAALIQFVAIPVFFSDIDAGNGLMIGADWIFFHQVATDLAAQMGAEGFKS